MSTNASRNASSGSSATRSAPLTAATLAVTLVLGAAVGVTGGAFVEILRHGRFGAALGADPMAMVVIGALAAAATLASSVLAGRADGEPRSHPLDASVTHAARRLATILNIPVPDRPAATAAAFDGAVDRIEQLDLQLRMVGYERARLGGILDRLPEGLLETDTLGAILYVNRAAAHVLGIDEGEARGTHLDALRPEIVAGLDDEDSASKLTLTDTGGVARSFIVTRFQLGAQRTRDGGGTLYVFRDVTAQASAERTQIEFLSQIAHELKAPLNSIVTYADALADNDRQDANERRRFFNTINGEAQRMGGLITNLLEISRIRLGNLTARFGFVKTTALVNEIASSFRAQADGKGVTFSILAPENLPPLHGDKDLIGVAISNLVSNALKYTPAGGTVSVRADSTAASITIEITDTGVGIPEDVLPTIFQQFTRSEQSEVRQQPGSGLGLSLVREIVEVHGGRVEVSSSLGRGSTFTVSLPARTAGTRFDLAA